ncbi:MAG: hypothetical protein KIS92_11045 [Planctomycetota bacterium]|nr:hypothetical protein [Planctomycetota bacterium]
MCRYAFHNYRDHFACFDCRKSFKYWQWEPCDEKTFIAKQRLEHVPREIVCPECKRPMFDMGLDFKAPRKSNRTSWKVAETLARNGFTFHDCGCGMGVRVPRTMREVTQWLEARREKSDGEKLLQGYGRRSKRNKRARA